MDGLIGVLISTLIVGAFWQGGLRSAERWVYDAWLRGFPERPSAEVVLLEIDQAALDRLGSWPWPREVRNELLSRLASARPSAVGLALDLTRPLKDERDPAIAELYELARRLPATVDTGPAVIDRLVAELTLRAPDLLDEIAQVLNAAHSRQSLATGMQALQQRLQRATAEPDPNLDLIERLDALPGLVLSFRFAAQGRETPPAQPPPAVIERFGLVLSDPGLRPRSGRRLRLPDERFAAIAAGLGYLDLHPDEDGVLRSGPLLVRHQGRLLPSFALALIAVHQGLDLNRLQVVERGLALDGLRLPVGPELRSAISFYPDDALSRHSLADLLDGKVAASALQDAIVLIGPTAAGAAPRSPTPGGDAVSPIELAAHSLSNLLLGHGVVRPAWTGAGTWAALGVAALFVVLLLPRLGGPAALLVGLLSAALAIGAEYGLLIEARLWLPLVPPALLFLAGTLGLLAVRGLRAGPAGVSEAATDRRPTATEAKPPASVAVVTTPERFGRYRVEEARAKGGSGARYVGRDPQTDRRVLLSAFDLGLGESELSAVARRFLADVEQAKALDHPNILAVLDGGEERQQLFVASEYVEGWDLSRVARPDRLLKIPQALEIAAKCADALAHAHAGQLVHGEVCPSNVLYGVEDKQIRLTGWGTAAVTAALHARGDRLLPTSFYLPPEHWTGDAVGGRADLFSLGVTLYQLLSGQLPFRADSLATLTYRVVNEPHPPIQPLRPEVPDCAVLILERCLAKASNDRFPDALAAARALRACARRVLREDRRG